MVVSRLDIPGKVIPGVIALPAMVASTLKKKKYIDIHVEGYDWTFNQIRLSCQFMKGFSADHVHYSKVPLADYN